jgi:hypothetical protein
MDMSQMVKFAGNSVPMNSSTMEPSATSQLHTEEALVTLNNSQDTKSGEPFGILNAERTSIMLDAACAHQTAQKAWTTLVSHAPRTPITEISLIVNLLFAHPNL